MSTTRIQGGAFLTGSPALSDLFTPEDFTDKQKMIAEATRSFVEQAVRPHLPAIEQQEFDLTVRLLRQAGELGLLATDVPEQFGGLGLDKAVTTLVTEHVGAVGAFGVSLMAHTGIGTLPIVFFGTPEQKQKYLSDLASGNKLAAYALTEPGSGSDALAARTTARLSPDGAYWILNGTKQFTTNAGFADLFVVYAKVDGEKFTAFLVEKDFPGVATGAEEKKLGIKGSSTRQLILTEARVPVENRLGEIGKGHLIAFNILNIGRWKLGAYALGACKRAIEISARYANERQQFGRPISAFPLIRQKLADMAIRTYVAESMVYRTAGLFEAAVSALDPLATDAGRQSAQAIAEYAIECSINKVFGSEALDFVVDEGVQIHGGNGFMEEYEIARIYRDSRINRIFEGTNEINRLIITGQLLKRAQKGELPLHAAPGQPQAELPGLTPAAPGDAPLAAEQGLLDRARSIFRLAAGLAVQRLGVALEAEQEIMAALADIAIALFAAESAVLRAEKARLAAGAAAAAAKIDMAVAHAQEAFARIEASAQFILAAVAAGEEQERLLAALQQLTRRPVINLLPVKRRVAERVLAAQAYTA